MKRPRLVNRPDVRFFGNRKFSLERSPSAGLEALDPRQMLSGVDLLVAAYDSTGGNSVLRFNDVTHSPTQGTVATGDHGLNPPTGIAVNPVDHSFYVSSPSSGGILHYDVNGNYIDSIGVGTLIYPGTLAMGPNGNLYVADIYAGTIYQFDTTTESVVDSDFLGYAPAGMTFVPDGTNDLVVGGFDNQDVIRYTSSGPQTLVDASQGLNINPLSLLAEANGDVIIGDSNISPPDSANHHAIWLYDASSGLTTKVVDLTTPSDPGGDPPQPSSLLLDTDGNLLVGLSPDHVGDGAIEKYKISDFSYMSTPISNIGSTSGMALIPSIASAVAGTDLFYKGSSEFDVTNGATFSDDNAIAPNKSAYLPGTGNATFASVSSYTQGLNGLMVDLAGAHGTLTASDFIFKAGNNLSPSTWSTTTSPQSVTTRAAAGIGGSDRVELSWTSGAVTGKWLEVIVKGNDALGGSDTNTGLAASYVFYYGSAPGDTGSGDVSSYSVDSTDGASVLSHPHNVKNPAAISDVDDFNRDGLVNSTDGGVVLSKGTTAKTALIILDPSAEGPFAPAAAPAGDSSAGGAVASALAAGASPSASPSSGVLPPALSNLIHLASHNPVIVKEIERWAAEIPLEQAILSEVEKFADSWGLDDELLESLLAH